MNVLKIFFTLFFVTIVSCASKDKVTSLDPQVEMVLEDYNGKIENHRSQGAGLISPERFEKVQTIYAEAKSEAYQGKPLAVIVTKLETGAKYFSEIDRNMKLASVHLSMVLDARAEAMNENATYLEVFKDANKELIKLGENLEERDLNKVVENRAAVISLYVKAEILAIQNRELMNAKRILEKSQELGSIAHFKSEEKQAQSDIHSAATLIEKFKDSPDRYEDAVKKAERHAKRLLALCKTGNWIDEKPTREVVLKIDSDLNQLVAPMVSDQAMLMSYNKKVRLAIDEIESVPYLLEELSSAEYETFMQKKNLRLLESKNRRISNKLASKRRVQEKIRRIRSLFDENEASIFIKGDDLIIKLVGLNFAFNDTNLPQGSKVLLKKVVNSAKTLDFPDMKIIGHADSRGDASYNQKLSNERAEKVSQYLVSHSNISEDSTYTVGAGYRKPIAENRTGHGRKSNRRIDVVFNSVVQ